MKIVAIDSSGLVASVAVVEDNTLLAEYTMNYKKTHSQTLLPMLDEVTKMIELDLQSVDAFAIAKGPGSFTGLRIGSATVKGLGLALDKPIVEVPTVDGIAYQLYGCTDIICPMMDARRGQVYTGLYTYEKTTEGYRFVVLKEQCACSVEEILMEAQKHGKNIVLLGDGVPVYLEIIDQNIKCAYTIAPAYCNRQRSAAIGALAMAYFAEGKFVDAREHAPDYLRLSQAERERKERQENQA